MDFDKNGILNRTKAAQQSTVAMDEGLRAYMLKVYNYMATGILLTGIVALLTFKISVVTNDAGSIVCLLYTSPSPRDLSTSRMPSSA